MEGESILEALEELYEILYYGLGVAELGVAGVIFIGGLIASLVTAVVTALVTLLLFILEAVPLYKISKRMHRKHAWLVWLAWIPVVGPYINTYVLADVCGQKPVKLIKDFRIESRLTAFLIFAGISLFGAAIITAIIGIVNVIPGLGQLIGAIGTLLYFVPPVAAGWIEYAFLRDVLDIFKADKKSNQIAAIVITAVDTLVTFGLARAVYLYTVMNKQPLPAQMEKK